MHGPSLLEQVPDTPGAQSSDLRCFSCIGGWALGKSGGYRVGSRQWTLLEMGLAWGGEGLEAAEGGFLPMSAGGGWLSAQHPPSPTPRRELKTRGKMWGVQPRPMALQDACEGWRPAERMGGVHGPHANPSVGARHGEPRWAFVGET